MNYLFHKEMDWNAQVWDRWQMWNDLENYFKNQPQHQTKTWRYDEFGINTQRFGYIEKYSEKERMALPLCGDNPDDCD